jgi:hypothetical protein
MRTRTEQETLPQPNEAKAKAPDAPLRVDLRTRYQAIGISAVAAAARYQRADEPRRQAGTPKADRSTARGWSSANG